MSMPMQHRHYKYADYSKWAEGERVELIDGHVYAMTPAPSRIHQEILGNLYNEFANYLRGKRCRPYIAPFDVRLPKGNELDEEIDTVVQPDLSIVCDPEKLDDKGCKGAPDLIAEIISPSSLKLDTTAKKALYERVGVKQYWIVYPHEKIVMVYTLKEERRYDDGEAFSQGDLIPVIVLENMTVSLERVFS
ncbi:Uma2 family endonuclease [Paenibacillus ginsengarvi]|uniref:Uma2 family endonuclease n=1 Tax=Paenibacillus ginsengarvi TaxID=400777 RepID=A0A3B0ANN6_9BACL|nr:Uma2 family endonuclease [Paenibacillus ginsengarvi]RKN61941.1 Uma2 family endonuclease [Paenibacillus ginsengarvi]